MTKVEQEAAIITTPPALIAIAVAAHKTGDRDLRRLAVRELLDAHGIKVSFASGEHREHGCEVTHA